MSTVRRGKKTETDVTRRIEGELRKRFPIVEAYQTRAGSIRVRVVDPRFEGKSISQRDKMVSPLLARFPEESERDILMLLMVTPEETRSDNVNRHSLVNLEFEHPSF